MTIDYKLEDLLAVMQQLRDPNSGCPWDIAQNFASIVPSTLEEAYEVADTIERNDFNHLEEELGDLLFQVIFYAQLGSENKLFSFNSIVHVLTEKLVRRHPHVFHSGKLYQSADLDGNSKVEVNSAEQVKQQWEDIKSLERAKKGRGGQLADVPTNFPSVTRAQKLQKRAAQVGFDFSSILLAMEKVYEELAEVEAELDVMDGDNAQEALGQELGDLLFSVVNVCRLAKFDAETLLRATNRKFEHRFLKMEQSILGQGGDLETSSLEVMEAAWSDAKKFDR